MCNRYHPFSERWEDILGPIDHDRYINVLSKEFVLDKDLLKHDYLKPENTDKKNQFFENYNEQERNSFKNKNYEMVTNLQTYFSFWVLDYYNKKISVIEKTLSWTKTKKPWKSVPNLSALWISHNESKWSSSVGHSY